MRRFTDLPLVEQVSTRLMLAGEGFPSYLVVKSDEGTATTFFITDAEAGRVLTGDPMTLRLRYHGEFPILFRAVLVIRGIPMRLYLPLAPAVHPGEEVTLTLRPHAAPG